MKVITKKYPRSMKHLTLYPISDVHWGAAECMEQEFKAYLKQIESDPNAAVLLAGDLINNGIKSSVTNVYEEKYTPHKQKKDMIAMLEPIKDKIVAGVTGNHERRSLKETYTDITDDIFTGLSISDLYLGDAGVVKISIGSKKNKKPATYMIYLSHGSGGGGQLGSGMSKQDNFHLALEGIDISITGHIHRPMKARSSRLVFDPQNNKVTRRNTLLFVCTSWLEYAGYAEQKQFRPVAFHPDTIRLSGREKACV